VLIIGQSKKDEGINNIRNKVYELIFCYEALKKENIDLKNTIFRLGNELKEKNHLLCDLEQHTKDQEKKILDLGNSLNKRENLENDNYALKKNLEQLSIEFQNTKEELNKIKSHSEQKNVGAKQHIDSVKMKIKEMIFKIDDALSVCGN
jgi:hypothetical protein